jgi:hypothetical protein
MSTDHLFRRTIPRVLQRFRATRQEPSLRLGRQLAQRRASRGAFGCSRLRLLAPAALAVKCSSYGKFLGVSQQTPGVSDRERSSPGILLRKVWGRQGTDRPFCGHFTSIRFDHGLAHILIFQGVARRRWIQESVSRNEPLGENAVVSQVKHVLCQNIDDSKPLPFQDVEVELYRTPKTTRRPPRGR